MAYTYGVSDVGTIVVPNFFDAVRSSLLTAKADRAFCKVVATKNVPERVKKLFEVLLSLWKREKSKTFYKLKKVYRLDTCRTF